MIFLLLMVIIMVFVGVVFAKERFSNKESGQTVTMDIDYYLETQQHVEKIKEENMLLQEMLQLPILSKKEKEIVKKLEIECKAKHFKQRNKRLLLTAMYLEMHQFDSDDELMNVMEYITAAYRKEMMIISKKQQEIIGSGSSE